MSVLRQLHGRVTVIIGGAGGIGSATARMFAEAGAFVVITHRPDAPGETIKADAANAIVASLPGERHAALPADVADTATLQALYNEVSWRYGRCNILINTAGFTKPIPHDDLEALDDDLIDRLFQVNWRGQFAAIRIFAPLMKESSEALIVSVSSVSGTTGLGSSIAYCAAKAGIDVMTKSLARVLAPEVRVLAVSPGAVDTGFVPGRGAEFNARAAASTPLKRVAQPEDVAAAILACATHLSFSTGTTIVVDGGRSL